MVQRGWIRLYRRIQDHDLWKRKPFDPGKAWVDLLLHTDHNSCTVSYPQTYWAKRWGWSRDKVQRFFSYLKEESMIEVIESGKIGERTKGPHKQAHKLHVCNYYYFQQPAHNEAHNASTHNTITNINNTLKEQIYIVGHHWNSKKVLQTHGPKTIGKCLPHITQHLLPPYGRGDYWTDDICKAICNYATVLAGPEYFWSYKWTLKHFLQRGVDRFVDEAEPLTNFLENKKEEPNAWMKKYLTKK